MDKTSHTFIKSNSRLCVKKVTGRVLIFTEINKIEGNVHNYPALRLNDLLNSPIHFIPLTDAVVYDYAGKVELYRTDFLSINKNIIHLIMELGPPG